MKISEIIRDKYKLRIPPTVYYELLADVQEAEEEQEPTTKNDLGVDCISRQAVIDLMMQKWGENFSGDSAMQESIDAIRVMPSVTPQEPRWILVSERYPKIEDEYKYFLVTDDKGKVSVQEFFMSLDEEPQPYFSGMLDVTAWMPLPQPYREVKG